MIDHAPTGDATNHDRIPPHIFDAALMAAFPGLPDTMTLDQAGRRVAAALNAAIPLIEQEVRKKIAAEATKRAGSQPSSPLGDVGGTTVAEFVENLARNLRVGQRSVTDLWAFHASGDLDPDDD